MADGQAPPIEVIDAPSATLAGVQAAKLLADKQDPLTIHWNGHEIPLTADMERGAIITLFREAEHKNQPTHTDRLRKLAAALPAPQLPMCDMQTLHDTLDAFIKEAVPYAKNEQFAPIAQAIEASGVAPTLQAWQALYERHQDHTDALILPPAQLVLATAFGNLNHAFQTQQCRRIEDAATTLSQYQTCLSLEALDACSQAKYDPSALAEALDALAPRLQYHLQHEDMMSILELMQTRDFLPMLNALSQHYTSQLAQTEATAQAIGAIEDIRQILDTQYGYSTEQAAPDAHIDGKSIAQKPERDTVSLGDAGVAGPARSP